MLMVGGGQGNEERMSSAELWDVIPIMSTCEPRENSYSLPHAILYAQTGRGDRTNLCRQPPQSPVRNRWGPDHDPVVCGLRGAAYSYRSPGAADCDR